LAADKDISKRLPALVRKRLADRGIKCPVCGGPFPEKGQGWYAIGFGEIPISSADQPPSTVAALQTEMKTLPVLVLVCQNCSYVLQLSWNHMVEIDDGR